MKGTLRDFTRSVSTDDFSALYGNIAELWKIRITEEKLREIFAGFVALKRDLSAVLDGEIVYSNDPFIDPMNFLNLQGYPAADPILYFTLKYTYEYPEWKLVSINVRLG